MDSNVEEVLRLKPDYVFTYVGGGKRLEVLKSIGTKIIEIKAETIEDIYKNYLIVGKIVNKEKLAKEKVKKIKQMLNEKRNFSKINSTIIVLYADSLLSGEIYSAGRNTYFSEIIENFGLKNITPKLGEYPVISKEGFLRLNPDTIFVISPKRKNVDFCKDSAYKSMKVCKNNTLFMLSGEKLLHPGPSIFIFIKQIQKVLKENDFN